jgi:hypothetical protein
MEEVLERDEAFYPDVFVFVSGELGGDSHSVRAIYGMGRDGISSSPHGSSQSPRSWRYRRARQVPEEEVASHEANFLLLTD